MRRKYARLDAAVEWIVVTLFTMAIFGFAVELLGWWVLPVWALCVILGVILGWNEERKHDRAVVRDLVEQERQRRRERGLPARR